jgi:opacity protein-like surface antigen
MVRRGLAIVLFMVAGVLAMPWPAEAQQRDFDPYVSIFGGYAMPNNTDITITSPALNTTVKSVELDNSATYGLKAGVWSNSFRDMTNFDFGLQLDVTRFHPSQAGGQNKPTSSSVAGVPITFTTGQINMDSTLITANFLARLPIGVSAEYPNGEWYPYVGAGIGLQRTDYNATGGSGTANDLAYQFLGGLQYMITQRLGLYAEYKYSMSEQNIKVGSQDGRYNFNVSHFVGGLALHF